MCAVFFTLGDEHDLRKALRAGLHQVHLSNREKHVVGVREGPVERGNLRSAPRPVLQLSVGMAHVARVYISGLRFYRA